MRFKGDETDGPYRQRALVVLSLRSICVGGKADQREFKPLCTEGKTLTSEYKARSFQAMMPIELDCRPSITGYSSSQHLSTLPLRGSARLLWLRFIRHRGKKVNLHCLYCSTPQNLSSIRFKWIRL
ncbi:hypothetical protein ARMGADRAFT_1017890 [Armillaria gallica]|uniref:Uncharacterized protein n=1 Tax=Armillaria gallica TaxID=47427 RepID=A0A2H3CQY7_ARMGA|nr:hypothetical protein ARMGADRAFT_1017890 [Armillaria gallica]